MENNKQQNYRTSFWTNLFSSTTERDNLRKSIKHIPIFNSLNRKELNELLEITHNRTYIPGEYIFLQGDIGIGLYLIREGEVEIKRKFSEQTELTLASLSKGDFFGELALIDNQRRSASAIAKTDCRISVLFKPDLDEFIEKFPRRGIKILQGISLILAERLRNLNEEYLFLLIKSQKGLQYEIEYKKDSSSD
jgi:CRP-like cAMP-binding protein